MSSYTWTSVTGSSGQHLLLTLQTFYHYKKCVKSFELTVLYIKKKSNLVDCTSRNFLETKCDFYNVA